MFLKKWTLYINHYMQFRCQKKTMNTFWLNFHECILSNCEVLLYAFKSAKSWTILDAKLNGLQ